MLNRLVYRALLLVALFPSAASSEQITLKLAFFSSDQTKIYKVAVKPFVDAVNAHDSIKIETYPSGIPGPVQRFGGSHAGLYSDDSVWGHE
jgi:hypothetical protein